MITIFRSFGFLLFGVAALVFPSRSVASTVSTGSWTPLYQGVDFATATIDGPDSSVAYSVRIDLTAPGISFLTTPAGGTLNTVSETTSQFLQRSGTQIAINANFFAPCCESFSEDKTLVGLAVSRGALVAPPTSTPGESNAALLISRTNVAAIATTTATMDFSDVYNAVAGSAVIVRGGVNVGSQSANEGDPLNPNPRSDAGVSQDGRFLYLLAVDGRQPGYSIGTTITETADMMLALGAYNAINLDGGGSTALAVADQSGSTRDLNRPSGGTERYDGNALGVYALPLDIPEPGSASLVLVGSVGGVVLSGRMLFRRIRN